MPRFSLAQLLAVTTFLFVGVVIFLWGFRDESTKYHSQFDAFNANATYFDPNTVARQEQMERLKLPATLLGAAFLGAGVGVPFKLARWGAVVGFLAMFGYWAFVVWAMGH